MIRSDILFASLWQIKKGCHALAVPPDCQNKIARDKSLELSLSSFHREPTLASYKSDNKGKILKSQGGYSGFFSQIRVQSLWKVQILFQRIFGYFLLAFREIKLLWSIIQIFLTK